MMTRTHSSAPRSQISSQGPSLDNQGHSRKGLCLFCQDTFIVREHNRDNICDDCLDIFGDEPEIEHQETGEA